MERAQAAWHKLSPATRLAAAYTLILLAISLLFSIFLYQVSVGQIDQSLRRQYGHFRTLRRIELAPPPGLPPVQDELDAAKHRLALRLIYFNVVILVAGSGASYWLAKRTMRPIEEALEAQTRFTADASHELRTPLTAMQTEIEVALRNPKFSKESAKQLLGSNLEELAKLTALADGLLRLARHNGNQTITEVVDLEKIVREAVKRTTVAANTKNITMRSEVEALEVTGDAPTLTELVVILLDNAIKYSSSGQSVTVSAASHGHTAELKVIDTGQGIKASDLPHVFDRFYRADRSRSKEQVDGYGLGLSIGQKIAEMHGGSIDVASTPNAGSAFTVSLQIAR